MPSQLSTKQLANMDIHRFLSGFPAWSSAYKNHFSNTSKMISPLLESISNSMYRIDSVYSDVFDSLEFGFSDKIYHVPSFGIPTSITTEYGDCEYIGEFGNSSLECLEISAISKGSNRIPEFKSLNDIVSLSEPFILNIPSNIYIKSSSNISDINNVIIKGYNEDTQYIEESIVISDNIPTETHNKFRIITEIHSEKSISISSFIDLSNTHSYIKRSHVPKRITDTRGNYISPRFYVDGRDLYIHNADSVSGEDAYKFLLGHIPERLFVNNLLDIVYLFESKLYTTKLSLDYTSISQYNSSANVNDFIVVDDENVSIGETCHITIKVDRLLSDFPNTNFIRLVAKNDSNIQYLDKDLNLSSNKDTWIPIKIGQNYIRFGVEIENLSPYEFIIETDDNRSFAAMTYINSLNYTEVADGILDIKIFNQELLAQYQNDGKYYSLSPIRLGYLTHGENIVFFNKFNNLDVSYD